MTNFMSSFSTLKINVALIITLLIFDKKIENEKNYIKGIAAGLGLYTLYTTLVPNYFTSCKRVSFMLDIPLKNYPSVRDYIIEQVVEDTQLEGLNELNDSELYLLIHSYCKDYPKYSPKDFDDLMGVRQVPPENWVRLNIRNYVITKLGILTKRPDLQMLNDQELLDIIEKNAGDIVYSMEFKNRIIELIKINWRNWTISQQHEFTDLLEETTKRPDLKTLFLKELVSIARNIFNFEEFDETYLQEVQRFRLLPTHYWDSHYKKALINWLGRYTYNLYDLDKFSDQEIRNLMFQTTPLPVYNTTLCYLLDDIRDLFYFNQSTRDYVNLILYRITSYEGIPKLNATEIRSLINEVCPANTSIKVEDQDLLQLFIERTNDIPNDFLSWTLDDRQIMIDAISRITLVEKEKLEELSNYDLLEIKKYLQ